ncbi:MAG: phenylalanine--tRNA ligase subunit beta [Bacteroidetes bacterium]|nr:phenylalanine--tRNA ligase subunit beta [Bacteroidota bacterium]
MTISYNWLCEYLPGSKEGLLIKPSPDQLSTILTSIGLEVEHVSKYESVKGGLHGLVIGEVVSAEKHPNADKLKLTKVNIGKPDLLQIVCGATNVAAGQKVIVAPPGTTIYPVKGEPFTINIVKIRGVESQGMICAEDEIGLGNDHAGIIVLPNESSVGDLATSYFHPYEDHIIEIGLTPNHMDAMSHLGIARDVCAYLSHHHKKTYSVNKPLIEKLVAANNSLPIAVSIENKIDCERYSGVSIKGISIKQSPEWMQQKLKAIGVRPINNIVDITNFVLHETGQPLHAYDADAIKGNQIIVKNLPAGTKFITLDEKERTLNEEDLMICNKEEGMCIAGVFGGLKSGVSSTTKNIFLEAAWFNPLSIRKTSIRHGLRTDAATHFEKGMDISGTVAAIKRASLLIKELADGEIASDIIDVYPSPKPKTRIGLKFDYLKKLSGKKYQPDAVKNILINLGFDIIKETSEEIFVDTPYHKTDISLPADIVEEIMRIDGLDNIEIPASINISPSIETDRDKFSYQEKIANYLTGSGFNEIFTNSITNSAYYSDKELEKTVRMINNLSTELNIMRPSLLETGLETISYNINRKNSNLRFFEFGKTYSTSGVGKYQEENHLCMYVTGNLSDDSWNAKGKQSDLYYLKGICVKIFQMLGISASFDIVEENSKLKNTVRVAVNNNIILKAGVADVSVLKSFDIRQPVFFADFYWDKLMHLIAGHKIEFRELPKQLPVYRDLAMVVNSSLPYAEVEKTTHQIGLDKLQKVQLFDIFESEKLGKDKKSLAISFTFMDEEKTLTDKEIDGMMNQIMKTFEEKLSAEIRK